MWEGGGGEEKMELTNQGFTQFQPLSPNDGIDVI